jgi:acetolactate synthase-1/2/3 large subunit
VIDTVPAEIDEFFVPAVELVGDIAHVLARLAAGASRKAPERPPTDRLRELALGALRDGARDDHFPMRPARVLHDLRRALGRDDLLVSDVGLHKLWIGRMFPAHEPGTVLIANGLAGMGFALPTAIAAKLVHPHRHVVTVSGDGGFLMNCQELETAVRLKTAVVNVIWENQQFGSIVWKQDKKFDRHFGVDFGPTDFVKLAEAFGAAAWRCADADDFARRLEQALALDGPSVIVVPIDYSIDVAISRELGAETVAT